MRLTDTIAGEEVHFEPCGPGHVISIEVGNGRHYEFELTETDLRLISDNLLRYMADVDMAQPFPCAGSHMPADGDQRTELRIDRQALRLAAIGHINELVEARYDAEWDGPGAA